MKELKIVAKRFPIYISMDIMIPAVIFSVLGEPKLFLLAFFFSLLHELSHLAMVRLLKYIPEKITVNMFGEILHIRDQRILPEHEILINISGPAFNLTAALLCLILTQQRVISGLEEVIIVNAILGIYNLLPFYPLDGGKIVFVYLKFFAGEELARRLIFLFAKVFLFFNFLFGLFLIQYNLLNLTICLLAANIYLSVRREESQQLYKGIQKAKEEQENGNYV